MIRSKVLVAAALLAGLALQATLVSIGGPPEPRPLMGDERPYWKASSRVLLGEEPGLIELWPQAYPRFLAWVRGTLGGVGAADVVDRMNPAGRRAVELTQALLLLFAGLAVRGVTRRLLVGVPGGDRAADLAGFFALLYPALAAYSGYMRPEALHMALFVGALWILWTGRGDGFGRPLAASLVLGAALVVKSVLLPFLPVFVWGVWREGRGAVDAPRRAKRAGVFLAGALAVVLAAGIVWPSPPTAGSTLDRIVARARFNLWVGLSDRGADEFANRNAGQRFYRYPRLGRTIAERDAEVARRVRVHIRRVGWPTVLERQLRRQYHRLFDRDTLFTAKLPGGVLEARGDGYRSVPTWLAVVLRGASFGLWSLVLLLAPLGIAVSLRRSATTAGAVAEEVRARNWRGVVYALFGYHLLMFFWLHAKSRFRLPMLPFLFAFAAVGLVWWTDRTRGAGEPLSRRALVTCGLVSLVLLGLAFGVGGA